MTCPVTCPAAGDARNITAAATSAVVPARHRELAWTDNNLSVLSVATSDSMTLADLYHWWLGDTGPEQAPG